MDDEKIYKYLNDMENLFREIEFSWKWKRRQSRPTQDSQFFFSSWKWKWRQSTIEYFQSCLKRVERVESKQEFCVGTELETWAQKIIHNEIHFNQQSSLLHLLLTSERTRRKKKSRKQTQYPQRYAEKSLLFCRWNWKTTKKRNRGQPEWMDEKRKSKGCGMN